MDEHEFVSESREGSDESIFTEHEDGGMPEGPVFHVNSLEGINRNAETIRAINRPLVSQQLSETIRAINRSLVSQQLSETIRAITINRSLVSQQLSETIRAITINRSLVSQQLSETIRAITINRSLVSQQLSETIRAITINRSLVSQQLSETIRAITINRSLFSQQLSETIRAINRPLVNPWPMGPTPYLNPRTNSALTPAMTVVTTQEEPQTRPDSLRFEDEDTPLIGEALYWLTQFDALVKDGGLRRCCRSLFADGYYSLSVQKAYIYIDNLVSKRSGRTDIYGADLMRTVFSPKNPVLKLNGLESRSEENQQQGYMHIFEGAMIGIRNPRAHEHELEDSPEEALEMLVLANHLMRMLNKSG